MALVDNCYNLFNCNYQDAQIVKLGAVAPDVYCPYSVYSSHEMFHAISKHAEHNYVRVCEYIMNLATHCKKYGHQSAMTSNCKPDNVNDPDYNTVRGWLGQNEITVMLAGQYAFNDKNASLIMLGIAMHVMGDAYAHQSRMYENGKYIAPYTIIYKDGYFYLHDQKDDTENIPERYECAKESMLNLWTNYYNNIKTNGSDFEGKSSKFRMNKLSSYIIASRNGNNKNYYFFEEVIKISCND